MMITLGMMTMAGFSSFGQDAKPADKTSYTSLGPVAGFGHSWVSGMNNQQFKPSAHLGISMIYSKHEHWAWGANLVASHEGYAHEYMWAGNQYRMSVDPTYLRLTPRAYYFFGDYKSNVRPKVYLGPSVGVKVQEDQYTRNMTMNTSDVVMSTPATAERFRTMDLGAEAGAGVNIKIGTGTWLNLDANYYRGFINSTYAGNMNQNLRFNVGVMMGL